MYDENIKTISFTSDEVDILNELLLYRLDKCISIGEEITVRDLFEKLK